MRKKSILTLFIVLFLITTSCSNTEVFELKDYSIQSCIEYLASDELKGRLPGTEGNKKAEEYISSQFEAFGLEPVEDDGFLVPFEQKVFNPDNQVLDAIVTHNNNKVKQLVYGKDIIEITPMENMEIEGIITFDINDEDLENKFLVLATKVSLSEINGDIKGILYRKDNFKRLIINLSYNDKYKHIPSFQISDSTYKFLEDNKDYTLNIKYKRQTNNATVNNVVGKISGINSKEAIVISAHFDHIGWIGETIYNGAVDNASGVTTMLSLAKEIKEYSKNKGMEKDIIFIGFNGEESGLKGSNAYVNKLKDRYNSISNINIDCVGMKDGGDLKLLSDTTISKDLANDLKAHLEKEDEKIGILSSSASDHASFSDIGIQSLTVIQENIDDIVHTTQDTIKMIDVGYIKNLSKEIMEFVINNKTRYKIQDPIEGNKNKGGLQTNDWMAKLDKDVSITVIPKSAFYKKEVPEGYVTEEIEKDGHVIRFVYEEKSGKNLQVFIESKDDTQEYGVRLYKAVDGEKEIQKQYVAYPKTEWSLQDKQEILNNLTNIDIDDLLIY